MADFLPGVPTEKVIARLNQAAGNELESGKLASPESSAALAVNTFGWFMERPAALPRFPGVEGWSEPQAVTVEYCARFPWTGGRHPWLDAMVETAALLIGVESKRFEPFRDRKAVALSPAYDRPAWGDQMGPYESMRDALRSGALRFDHLDAAQLVKHAFGLVTDARRRAKQPVLVYLFAEPAERNGVALSPAVFGAHREEIRRFAEHVAGAEVRFAALSYREWLATWRGGAAEAHAAAIVAAYQP